MSYNKHLDVRFENGKTIIDGIPSLLYINATGHGVGQMYRSEERLAALQKLTINADTDAFVTCDVKIVALRNKEIVTLYTEGEIYDTYEIEVENND